MDKLSEVASRQEWEVCNEKGHVAVVQGKGDAGSIWSQGCAWEPLGAVGKQQVAVGHCRAQYKRQAVQGRSAHLSLAPST